MNKKNEMLKIPYRKYLVTNLLSGDLSYYLKGPMLPPCFNPKT